MITCRFNLLKQMKEANQLDQIHIYLPVTIAGREYMPRICRARIDGTKPTLYLGEKNKLYAEFDREISLVFQRDDAAALRDILSSLVLDYLTKTTTP